MTDWDTVKALHDAGWCVVPVRPDGSKAPAVKWKQYTAEGGSAERMTLDEIRSWWERGYGVGVVCGAASANLEMLEFEARAVDAGLLTEAGRTAADNALGQLWERVASGYVEASPRGGVHLHFHVAGTVRQNTVLAADTDGKVLIETRGEDGFTVTAPSSGRVHPEGGAWQIVVGAPADAPTLTADEYDALHLLLGMLDRAPQPEQPLFTQPIADAGEFASQDPDGLRPGDDYAARHTWEQLLTERGWQFVRRVGPESCWRRPGKGPGTGISATTGRGGHDNLWNFSSNADLPVGQPISKLMAYAHWNHGGDLRAAVRELAGRGYGATRPALQLVHSAPRTDGGTALALQPPVQAAPTGEASAVSLTDEGNARLLSARHGRHLRHAPGIGWVVWEGTRWSRDGEPAALQLLIETVHSIQPGADAALARHKVRSLNLGPLRSALGIAATLPELRTEAATLDSFGTQLAHAAGAVDLLTGRHLPPDPRAWHTRHTGVVPQRAPIPMWLRFLDDTFGDDPEVIGYVQRLVGYSASGTQGEHVLPFLLGGGDNGKSVFTRVVARVLGDYAINASSTFLMGGRQTNFETELARLHGARVVLCAEVGPRDRFDEQRIKLLTGGDSIQARHLYQRHFDFDPTHHLWLVGNHQPSVDAGGHSFWRRLRLVNFPNRVDPDKRIPMLADKLLDSEAPGILQWIVDGAVAYFRDGLQDPESVICATREYAAEEDALARFVDDCCHVGGGAALQVDTGKMRAAYTEWCHAEGVRPLAPPHFGREMRQRYEVTTRPSNGHRFYVGLGLQVPDAARGWEPS